MMTAASDRTRSERDVTGGEPANRSAWQSGTGGLASEQHTLKLLIVDDSRIVCERLAAQVGEVPRVELVGLAADGSAAIRLFQERHPDVVVLDIGLPGSSGFELLTRIKRQRPECVVIMFTDHASTLFRLGGSRLGADFFFSKSNEFERINDVLKAILNRGPRASVQP